MRRLSLYHLETLLWISRLGTFAAAAERLNTTQPAISARVRELESRLGYAIFQRAGRAMARMWRVLMEDVLGYRRFYAQGGDYGRRNGTVVPSLAWILSPSEARTRSSIAFSSAGSASL